MSKAKFHAASGSGKPHHMGRSGGPGGAHHGAIGGHGEGGGAHSGGHHGFHHGGNGGNEPKTVLDGTVQGHKRKYKPANGIYQPPL